MASLYTPWSGNIRVLTHRAASAETAVGDIGAFCQFCRVGLCCRGGGGWDFFYQGHHKSSTELYVIWGLLRPGDQWGMKDSPLTDLPRGATVTTTPCGQEGTVCVETEDRLKHF